MKTSAARDLPTQGLASLLDEEFSTDRLREVLAPPGEGAGAEEGATANEDKSDKSDVAKTAAGEETGEETKKTATHTRFADVEGDAEADANGGRRGAGEGGGDDAATE